MTNTPAVNQKKAPTFNPSLPSHYSTTMNCMSLIYKIDRNNKREQFRSLLLLFLLLAYEL